MAIGLGLIASLAAATLAAAPTTTSSAVAGQAGSDSKDSQIVCKKQTKVGTRFAGKTCKTREQWEQLREQHLRDAREMIDTPKICGGGGSMEGC